MPRTLVPRKSGIHRAACFALYRAVLRQSWKLPLGEQQHDARRAELQIYIKNAFRHHAKTQSPIAIRAALVQGYQALDTKRNAIEGTQNALAHLAERMDRLEIKTPQKSPTSGQNGKVNSINARRLEQAQHSAFTSASRAIFARPYPSLSGLRTVPHLISANGFPFLRYNRPQPPSLSRVIRDRIIAFQHRVDRLHDYQDMKNMGRAEDAWEESLKRYCGLEKLQGPSWTQAPVDALDDVIKVAKRQTWKTKTMAMDMYQIMEGERKLAEKEKIARRDNRHKRYRARRHERSKDIQGEEDEENVFATMSGT